MSYICLMANASGAVAAGDSRETFPAQIHLDWRQKCFALPKRQLIWACCGPTLRFGVDILRSVTFIMNSGKPMETRLARVETLVRGLTRFHPASPAPGPFRLIAAQWEENGFTLWDCTVQNGLSTTKRLRLPPGEAFCLHAGAWHRAMPRLEPDSLRPLSYEALREAAQSRVALAIQLDEARRAKQPKYNQTIGGRVRSVGIRVKRA